MHSIGTNDSLNYLVIYTNLVETKDLIKLKHGRVS